MSNATTVTFLQMGLIAFLALGAGLLTIAGFLYWLMGAENEENQ